MSFRAIATFRWLPGALVVSAFAASELPEGAGKPIIERHCSGCHAGAAERLELPLKEAEAIVNDRERRGSFRTWGDLLVIYGVDGAKIEAVRDQRSF